MRKIVLNGVKTLLFIFFFYNIGLFSIFSHLEETPSPPNKADKGKADAMFLEEKIERAQALGTTYGPEEYFADLTDIRLKQKRNDFDLYVNLSIQSSIERLLNVFNQNMKNAHRDLSEEDYENLMSRLDKVRDQHLEVMDPGYIKRQQEIKARQQSPDFWPNLIISFLYWLAGFYLKNVPLAFILMWVWWYQDKNRVIINNPLSFLICLSLYPIIIGRAWKRVISESTSLFNMQVAFRKRQVNLFSMVSADELSYMRHLVKTGLDIKVYQQELDARGFISRHALVPALLVTMVLLIMPNSIFCANDHDPKTTTEQIINAPPGISNYQLQIDHHFDDQSWPTPNLTEELVMTAPYFLLISSVLGLIPELLEGYRRQLKPIPLLLINL